MHQLAGDALVFSFLTLALVIELEIIVMLDEHENVMLMNMKMHILYCGVLFRDAIHNSF